MNESDADHSRRWKRRAERIRSERARIKKHGASIKRVYKDAVLKRRRRDT
ncbi:MAG TPA: hypothetical protein VH951_06355 [Dehalococcoidia bacterium]